MNPPRSFQRGCAQGQGRAGHRLPAAAGHHPRPSIPLASQKERFASTNPAGLPLGKVFPAVNGFGPIPLSISTKIHEAGSRGWRANPFPFFSRRTSISPRPGEKAFAVFTLEMEKSSRCSPWPRKLAPAPCRSAQSRNRRAQASGDRMKTNPKLMKNASPDGIS